MEQVYQKYRKIKNSILKNKIAVIVIGIICIIPIIYLVNIFIYDEYTVVKTVPEKVKNSFKVYWEGYSVDQKESKLAQKGIKLTYENGLTKYIMLKLERNF